ncbi:hypothetical protein Tco_1266727, partial [Tanacetum coccineum]
SVALNGGRVWRWFGLQRGDKQVFGVQVAYKEEMEVSCKVLGVVVDIDGIGGGCVSSFTLEMQVTLHNEIKNKIPYKKYLRFEGLEYTDADITDFKEILSRIYGREVHRVYVFDFGVLTDLMDDGLSNRMLMEHTVTQGQIVFTSRVRCHMIWREFILRMGLHTTEEIESAGFGAYWAESSRQIPDKGDLSVYWVGISSVGDFLGTAPSYTSIRDPMLRLCHKLITCSIAGRSQAPETVIVTNLFYLREVDVGSVNIPYLLARYLRRYALGRKQGGMIAGGHFVAPLGLERQQVVAVGAPEAAKDALVVDEGA